MRNSTSQLTHSFFILLLFAAASCFPFSLRTLDSLPGGPLDTGITNAVSCNEADLEKLAGMVPASLVSDSLKLQLRQSFLKLRTCISPDTGLKSGLLACLMMVRLGDLGATGYYDSAKIKSEKMGRRFPANNFVCWMYGLSCVKTGEISRGIGSLDSLYLSGFHDDRFLADYAACVFRAFVPEKRGSQSALRNIFIENAEDTLKPLSREWSMERTGGGPKVPGFIYGANFEITRPPHCAFQRVLTNDGRTFQLGIFPKAPVTQPPFEPFVPRTETIRCRLFIDPVGTRTSPFDYLSRRISGRYDSIHVSTELKQQEGISLRCFTLPRFLDDNGRYTAIAMFDRPFLELKDRRKHVSGYPEFTAVRYTIVLQSSVEEQAAADAKFQSILNAFFD